MSNPVQVTPSRRGRWLAGLPSLSVAVGLALIYNFVPSWTWQLSVLGRVMFRAVVVLFGMIGLAQIASAWSGTKGTIATPGFGRHRMVLPVEGIVYLVIMFSMFIGAMLTKSNMLLLVFALMAGPFVINGWMTYGMLRSAGAARTAPHRAMVGELFSVELELTNDRRLLSIWVMAVRDAITHPREDLIANVLFARVPPRSAQCGHYQLRLMRRGRYELGPLLTISRFPLGLVERSRVFSVADVVLIYPRIGRLNSNWKRRWMGATELVARPQAQAGVFHDEFHRLREFRTGDNPRDIHWRTSARRGELILREYQQNRDFNLAIILDLWQPLAARDADTELVERALSFTATLIVEHGRTCRDAVLSLSAAGATPFQWQGQGTSASLEALFDGLALMNAGPARESVKLIDETLQRASTSTRIIVVTTRRSDAPVNQRLENPSPRVDVIRLPEIELDQVMMFDDPLPTATAIPVIAR